MSSPAVANGKLYIGSNDYNIYCLDTINGSRIWNYTTGSWVSSSPAVAGGRIYVGSHDGFVYCLNTSNGDLIWKYDLEGVVLASPAVASDKIYIACIGYIEDHVYCLNAENGTLLWKYEVGDEVESSPAVFDKKVYIGSKDGYIYCLGNEESIDFVLFLAAGIGVVAIIGIGFLLKAKLSKTNINDHI